MNNNIDNNRIENVINYNINKGLINNAFECAEYLRDFCYIQNECIDCPLYDYKKERCSINTYDSPCEWDLVSCRIN